MRSPHCLSQRTQRTLACELLPQYRHLGNCVRRPQFFLHAVTEVPDQRHAVRFQDRPIESAKLLDAPFMRESLELGKLGAATHGRRYPALEDGALERPGQLVKRQLASHRGLESFNSRTSSSGLPRRFE